MALHELGRMSDTVHDLARDAGPRYRSILTRLPETLLEELDELIVQRVHEGHLPGGGEALASEREAHITLAVRALVDSWPHLPQPYATPEAERTGPDASTGGAPS